MNYYIAIDGGGTKTEGVLFARSGTAVAKSFIQSTNPNDIGVEISLQRLITLIKELNAALPSDGCLVSVYAGIAGAGNHGRVLEAELSKAFEEVCIGIGTDAEILCAGSLQDDGCCIISGTGSVCYVKRSDGKETVRIGGWGYLIDDGGSGYAIGRDALASALAAFDGRGSETILNSLLAHALGGEVHEKLSEIYAGGKTKIASLAPCVFEGAERGDFISISIIDKACEALADYIVAAYKYLNKPFTAVFGGGVINAHPELLYRISARVKNIPVTLKTASASPVYGAFILAKRLASKKNN